MLVSVNWLSQYVDLSDINPKELAEKITRTGIEVESVNVLSTATNVRRRSCTNRLWCEKYRSWTKNYCR